MERYNQQVREETAGTEEGRRPTVVPAGVAVKHDPEVVPNGKRRYLTVAYKLKVLDTVAALREDGHGEIGAYLRKEGLYYSSIRSWQTLRDQGLLTAGRKGSRKTDHETLLKENRQLRRELEKARKRLAKTEMIVELQKKLSAILDIETPNSAGRNDAE